MKSEAADGAGPVSSAINLFGESRIHGRKQERTKTHFSPLEEPSSNTRELHLANKNIGRFSELKRSADYETARAESELSSTRKTVRELRSQIEESNAKASAHKEETQLLKKPETPKGQRPTAGDHKYEELMCEIESLKEELSKLKLDMFHAFEEKLNAEKATEASEMRAATYMNMVGELVKEIEHVNEEHVLVEVARLEAVREAKEIEAEREAAFSQYSKQIKQARDQIREMTEEASKVKSLEEKLAATKEDLNVLQSEMELVRAMMKNSNGIEEEDRTGKEATESGTTEELLRAAKLELEAAKKELVSVRDQAFQLMASMDIVRVELKQTSKETARLRRLEEEQELAVQNLTCKLLKAKSRLEAVTESEEKARGIASNLRAALQQLQSEAESARKEKEKSVKETEIIEMDIRKTDVEIGLAEQRLEAAIQELERVKASEAAALGRLKLLSERAIKARASSAQHSSVIRISRFEYEYLTGHAEAAQKVADKKVAAAQAWVEALKASEREMVVKIEMAQKEIRDLEVVEVKEMNRMQRAITQEKALESELSKYRELVGRGVDRPFKALLAFDQLGLAGLRGFKALLASVRREEGGRDRGEGGGRGVAGSAGAFSLVRAFGGGGGLCALRLLFGAEAGFSLRRFLAWGVRCWCSPGPPRGPGSPAVASSPFRYVFGSWAPSFSAFPAPRVGRAGFGFRVGFLVLSAGGSDRTLESSASAPNRVAGLVGAWFLQIHLSGAEAGTTRSPRRRTMAGERAGSCNRCETWRCKGGDLQSYRRGGEDDAVIHQGRNGLLVRFIRHAWQDLSRRFNDDVRAEGVAIQACGHAAGHSAGAGVGGESGGGGATRPFRRHRFASPAEVGAGSPEGPLGELDGGSWGSGGLFKFPKPTDPFRLFVSRVSSEVWWAWPVTGDPSTSGIIRNKEYHVKGKYGGLSLEPKMAFGIAILIAYWFFYNAFCFLPEPDPGEGSCTMD